MGGAHALSIMIMFTGLCEPSTHYRTTPAECLLWNPIQAHKWCLLCRHYDNGKRYLNGRNIEHAQHRALREFYVHLISVFLVNFLVISVDTAFDIRYKIMVTIFLSAFSFADRVVSHTHTFFPLDFTLFSTLLYYTVKSIAVGIGFFSYVRWQPAFRLLVIS